MDEQKLYNYRGVIPNRASIVLRPGKFRAPTKRSCEQTSALVRRDGRDSDGPCPLDSGLGCESKLEDERDPATPITRSYDHRPRLISALDLKVVSE
jgi:hypothetical protein